MTKTELIRTVSKKSGITQIKAGCVIAAIIDAITLTLAAQKEVSMVGFGTFEVRKRISRSGRNPQTGETIIIPAGKYPAFRASKALKGAVK